MALTCVTTSRLADSNRAWLAACNIDYADAALANEYIIATYALSDSVNPDSDFKIQWRRAAGVFADVAADTEICWGTATVLVDGNPVGATAGCFANVDDDIENEGDNLAHIDNIANGDYCEIQWAIGFGSGALNSQEYEIQLVSIDWGNEAICQTSITTEAAGTSTSTTQTLSTSTTVSVSTSTTSSSTSTTQTLSTSTTESVTTSTSVSTTLSTSTTTTLNPATGGLAFGEQNPLAGETPVSWQTWSDGAGGGCVIIGDADWGKLQLSLNDEGRSDVYDFGNVDNRTITVTENRYGAGQGSATLQIRGQAAVFLQDDALPAWENYVAPINHTWRYIQARAINT